MACDRKKGPVADGRRDGGERVGVSYFGIVNARRCGLERGSRNALELVDSSFARFEAPRCGVQSAHDGQGSTALVRREIPIARAHGKPVGLADNAVSVNLDGQHQIARHPSNDEQLLKIFSTENRVARTDEGKELRDHGADALEVPRPKAPTERLAQRADANARLFVHFVELALLRCKNEDVSQGLKLLHIATEITRIAAEILAGTELYPVHEDRHDDEATLGLRLPHERKMSFVKSPHRRHKSHSFAAATRALAC